MRNFIRIWLLTFIVTGCMAGDSEKICGLSSGPDSVFTDFAVADFNNDGLSDFALGEWSEKNKSGFVAIYINRGEGVFEKRFSFDCQRMPAALTAGDFDSDGLTDIAYIEHPWFLNLRTGKDSFKESFRSMDQNQWSPSLAWGKLQKKGISNFLCGPVWRRWNLDKSFSLGYFSAEKKEPLNGNVIIKDTDSDGNPDVVFYKNYIRILYGPLPDIPDMKMKNSIAAYYVDIPCLFDISMMAFEDIDGDGITDIAAAVEGGGLMVFRQHLYGFDPAEKPSAIFPDACGAFCFEKDSLIYSDGKNIYRVSRKDILSVKPEKSIVGSFESVTKIRFFDKPSELILLSSTEFLIVRLP